MASSACEYEQTPLYKPPAARLLANHAAVSVSHGAGGACDQEADLIHRRLQACGFARFFFIFFICNANAQEAAVIVHVDDQSKARREGGGRR